MGNQKQAWKTYKNVFDEHSLALLEKLRSQGHFDELQSPIAIGKEANIFTATKGKSLVIVKIYRLENCNFNKMYTYLSPDPRFQGLKKKRRLIIFAWVQREYRNLLKAREAVRVPTPIAVKDNILVMELIGKTIASPKLKDDQPIDLEKFYDKTISGIKNLYKKAGMVHADLSEYNILNFEGEPVFIDFSQSTTTAHPMAEEFLERDCRNIANYFRKKGIRITGEELSESVRKKI